MVRFTEKQYQELINKKTPKKPSKYGNQIVTVGGNKFGSKDELKFYHWLRAVYKGDILCQYAFTLQDKFRDRDNKAVKELSYVVDFYLPELEIVIDVKGFRNEVFNIKEKLFKFKYPQYIFLVGSSKELESQLLKYITV